MDREAFEIISVYIVIMYLLVGSILDYEEIIRLADIGILLGCGDSCWTELLLLLINHINNMRSPFSYIVPFRKESENVKITQIKNRIPIKNQQFIDKLLSDNNNNNGNRLSIEYKNNCDLITFYMFHLNVNEPVIIRGIVDDWPAYSDNNHLWSNLDYLRHGCNNNNNDHNNLK